MWLCRIGIHEAYAAGQLWGRLIVYTMPLNTALYCCAPMQEEHAASQRLRVGFELGELFCLKELAACVMRPTAVWMELTALIFPLPLRMWEVRGQFQTPTIIANVRKICEFDPGLP